MAGVRCKIQNTFVQIFTGKHAPADTTQVQTIVPLTIRLIRIYTAVFNTKSQD